MDEADVDATVSDLRAWDLLEGAPPAWTRRFRGAVMRAAAALAERERAGERPDGPPLATAVARALASWPLPKGAAARPDHAKVLVAVELAALPAALRGVLSDASASSASRTDPSTRST